MRLLYLDIDSLRPDHLGCYGYHRATSPTIDAIARRGTRFAECYVGDLPCGPSRTAFASGRHGLRTGVNDHSGRAADPRPEGRARGFRDLGEQSLASCLRRAGHHATAITSFPTRHGRWSYLAGFHEWIDPGANGMERGDAVARLACDWIARQRGVRADWFLHVNLWDVHMPARAPAGFGEPFGGEPLPAHMTDEWWAAVRDQPGRMRAAAKEKFFAAYRAGGFGGGAGVPQPPYARCPATLRTRDDLRAVIDGYDTGILYADGQVARILEAAGWPAEDLVVVVSADHGESLGELGIFIDHVTADRATARVPLIIAGGGSAAGALDEGLCHQFDLAATLIELAGGAVPASWDARSLVPALAGRAGGRDQLVITAGGGTLQRSVRFGDWLYLRTLHDGGTPMPPELLFDLRRDPHELADLAAACPEVCAEGARRMSSWYDQQMDRLARSLAPGEVPWDPLWVAVAEGGPSHVRL